MKDNYSKASQVKMEARVREHMKNAETKVIKGEYLKEPATHFYNGKTGVNVVVKEGKFVTTYKPNPEQTAHLLKNGSLGGGK